MTYGQAAAGGVIGMAIVAAIINMDVGKIFFHPAIEGDEFLTQLGKLAAQPVALKEGP